MTNAPMGGLTNTWKMEGARGAGKRKKEVVMRTRKELEEAWEDDQLSNKDEFRSQLLFEVMLDIRSLSFELNVAMGFAIAVFLIVILEIF